MPLTSIDNGSSAEDVRSLINASIAAADTALQPGASHGLLADLSADDHPQYLTPERGDLRYLGQDVANRLVPSGGTVGLVLTRTGSNPEDFSWQTPQGHPGPPGEQGGQGGQGEQGPPGEPAYPSGGNTGDTIIWDGSTPTWQAKHYLPTGGSPGESLAINPFGEAVWQNPSTLAGPGLSFTSGTFQATGLVGLSDNDVPISTNGLVRLRVRGNGVINITNLPTSTEGLQGGDLWRDPVTSSLMIFWP